MKEPCSPSPRAALKKARTKMDGLDPTVPDGKLAADVTVDPVEGDEKFLDADGKKRKGK